MCNLSEGIEEKGIAKGRKEGEAEIITKLFFNGFSAEQIASMTDKQLEEIQAIIKQSIPT